MPCQSYDSSWDRADTDRQKIKELKAQCDMLARIACKALTELEKNEVEDLLLLSDDEVRTWWQKHKEDDAREQARLAEIERKERVKQEALARLSEEEKELLGLATAKKQRRIRGNAKNQSSSSWPIEEDHGEYYEELHKMIDGSIIKTFKSWEK